MNRLTFILRSVASLLAAPLALRSLAEPAASESAVPLGALTQETADAIHGKTLDRLTDRLTDSIRRATVMRVLIHNAHQPHLLHSEAAMMLARIGHVAPSLSVQHTPDGLLLRALFQDGSAASANWRLLPALERVHGKTLEGDHGMAASWTDRPEDEHPASYYGIQYRMYRCGTPKGSGR